MEFQALNYEGALRDFHGENVVFGENKNASRFSFFVKALVRKYHLECVYRLCFCGIFVNLF